jgi:hypothetical protein
MLKARDNPLASDRVLALVRYRPQGSTWPELLARLDALSWRCAIVGPKGTGKTTLLEDLSDHLTAAGRPWRLIRLSAESGRLLPGALDRLGRDEIILLDGAEQLSAARWALLRWRTRAAAGLVITTHSPGRLPTLANTTTTPQLLHQIMAELLPGSPPCPRHMDHLFRKHAGNMREVMRDLYDEHAKGVESGAAP